MSNVSAKVPTLKLKAVIYAFTVLVGALDATAGMEVFAGANGNHWCSCGVRGNS